MSKRGQIRSTERAHSEEHCKTSWKTDEQIEAIQMALNALEFPECMNCGECQRFVDEDTEGNGWCEEHDRSANCKDSVCGYYE